MVLKLETYFTFFFFFAVFLIESLVVDDFIVKIKLPFEIMLLCWGCTATRPTSHLPAQVGLMV